MSASHASSLLKISFAYLLKMVWVLHFELVEATQSMDTIALCYSSVMGKMAIEVMFFNEQGKISRVIAHYN